jgi:hypothetical protein
MKINRLIQIGFVPLTLLLLTTSIAAQNQVIVDFYYSETCGSCTAAAEILDQVILHYEQNNSDKVVFLKKEITTNATYRNEMRIRGLSYPSVIINNQTKIPKENITYDILILTIDEAIANLTPSLTYDPNITEIPLFGKINLSQITLPFLTIVLGTLDSFNPCAFFILIVLLSMLLHLQSRKKMMIVGSIFIFFSGFFYFLFMFILFNAFMITASMINILSVIVGFVAIIIGVFNVKDFFSLKSGPSISIPEEKRSLIYKKIRKVIKSPSLFAMLSATIFLAVSVNFYELLCTLGFPMIFTARLIDANLSTAGYYTYLFFYNVIYVIPLFIILVFVTYILGKTKLTEHQGGMLKLFSGIMILSFGTLFIINYKLLENIITPFALLGLSIILSFVVNILWKRYQNKKEKLQESQSNTRNIE